MKPTGERYPEMTERNLFPSILHRAVLDAFGVGVAFDRDARLAMKAGKSFQWPLEVRQARDWLCGGSKWFYRVCEFSEVDPGKMRTWANDMADKGWPQAHIKEIQKTIRTDYVEEVA